MTFKELYQRATILEANDSYMLGKTPNPTGFKKQSASAGIGFFKRDTADEKARDYYKGGVLPQDVSRGSISTPPEVKSTYNIIRDGLKVAASRNTTSAKIAQLFTEYMTAYEKIWSLNSTIENCIKNLQRTLKHSEKHDTVRIFFPNGGSKEVPVEERIAQNEASLKNAEKALNEHIKFIIDEKRPQSYEDIINLVQSACKELLDEEKEKAKTYGKDITSQFLTDFDENGADLFRLMVSFLAKNEEKRNGVEAFNKYKEFVDHRSDNIIYNDIVKTLNEWYKNIILRYPKQDGGSLVSLKSGKKSIKLSPPYQNLIEEFKRNKENRNSIPNLVDFITKTNAFTDHEKSLFADVILSYFDGLGTEASVIRAIRDAGEQIAG
jgi:hypothetical protein